MSHVSFTPEELAKLPVWARRKVETLERTVHEKQNRINALTDSSLHPDECAVVVQPFHDISFGVPDDTRIVFRLPDGDDARTRDLYLSIYDGRLRMHGDATLTIAPSASNSVSVGFTR